MVPDGNSNIAAGNLRIVLLWGEEPSDLDSHLWGPTIDGTGKFHIFYGDKTYYEFDETGESTIPAFLDLDDTTSPIEAGLGWITKFAEGKNFINRPMLEKQKTEGTVFKCTILQIVQNWTVMHWQIPGQK